MTLVLLRLQFAWRAVYINGWAHNGDEGDGGGGRQQSVFQIARKCLRKLSWMLRLHRKNILNSSITYQSTFCLHAFVIFTEQQNNPVSVFADWTSSELKNINFFSIIEIKWCILATKKHAKNLHLKANIATPPYTYYLVILHKNWVMKVLLLLYFAISHVQILISVD